MDLDLDLDFLLFVPFAPGAGAGVGALTPARVVEVGVDGVSGGGGFGRREGGVTAFTTGSIMLSMRRLMRVELTSVPNVKPSAAIRSAVPVHKSKEQKPAQNGKSKGPIQILCY